MSCCGQKRAAASASFAAADSAANEAVAMRTSSASITRAPPRTGAFSGASQPIIHRNVSSPISHNEPLLRYLGNSALSVRGPHSGRAYYFAEIDTKMYVDENDVDALLRTQLFVREADQGS